MALLVNHSFERFSSIHAVGGRTNAQNTIILATSNCTGCVYGSSVLLCYCVRDSDSVI